MIGGKMILGWLDLPVDESKATNWFSTNDWWLNDRLVINLVFPPNVFRANSENENGSFGSNESWEETEISERDVDHHNGSDSSEIIEEIIIEVLMSF